MVMTEKTTAPVRKIETRAFGKMKRRRGTLIVKARGSIYGSSRTRRSKSRIKLWGYLCVDFELY